MSLAPETYPVRSDEHFRQANIVMREVADKISNVEPVTLADLPLFQKFFEYERRQGRETHGNGWSYMVQMMNRIGVEGQPMLGYKYHDGENLLPVVAYPGKTNPEQINLYFVHPMGQEPMGAVLEVTAKLREVGFVNPIYAKKIFPDQAEYLLERGFSPIEAAPWDFRIHSEDDSFPELVFGSEYVEEIIPSRRNYKSTLANARRFGLDHEVRVSDFEFEDNAWEVTKRFFKEIEESKSGKVNLSSAEDYFDMIFHNPDRPGLYRSVVYAGQKPVGYYILEQQNNSSYVNYYASIGLRYSYRGIGDYLTLSAIELARENNLNLNMGGSEDYGIYGYKSKFGPYARQQMYWVVNLM